MTLVIDLRQDEGKFLNYILISIQELDESRIHVTCL
jgi:hypothetical protein